MRRTLLIILVGPLLLLVAPAPFEPLASRAVVAQEPTDTGLMAVARPPKREVYPNYCSIGWVTAVDAKSITLHWVRGIRAPNQPVVRFTACEDLAAGRVRLLEALYPPYPLADVRVGDFVYLLHGPIDGVNEFHEVYIWRRPGGRLGPPSVFAPTYKKSRYNVHYGGPLLRPYHEWINAIQDYEERGIPLPPDMRPKHGSVVIAGPGRLWPDGTISPPSYAAELAATRPGGGGYPLWDGTLHAIPMPREVPLKP